MKINISIDDVSPHPQSSVGVLDRCYHLISKFPDIKFTLFIPICYTRKDNKSYPISEYPKFCETIQNLSQDNFEIGYHGYHHGIIGKSNNDEFMNISYDETKLKIELMDAEIERANLKDIFKKIFRPPAWRMSPESFRAMKDCGFELFALTDISYAVEYYNGSEKKYPCTFSNQYPPSRPLRVEQKAGIVYHACEWDRNYLNKKMAEELQKFLSKNEKEFTFMEGLI